MARWSEHGALGAVGGGGAAGERTTHPAQPDASSLVLPPKGPNSSDPQVEEGGSGVIRKVRRTPAEATEFQGNGLVWEDGEWWIEWEQESYAPNTYEAALYGPDADWCAEAVTRAKPSWCPSSRRYIVSVTSGRAYSVPCLAWNCPGCNERKWFAARELFRLGIEAAWARGATLTDPRGRMTVSELGEAWDGLALLLRRGGPAPKRPKKPESFESKAEREKWKKAYARWRAKCAARKSLLNEYSAVVEFGDETGRIHLHVLLTGDYIPQQRLKWWAKRHGFGEITHIVEVEQGTALEVGAYAGEDRHLHRAMRSA